MKTIVVIAVLICLSIGYAKSQHVGPFKQQTCIVLALGGNELCGAQAAAWCQSMDSYRQSVTPLINSYGNAAEQSSASQSASECQSIEADNGNG
jgi:hypothetical protein